MPPVVAEVIGIVEGCDAAIHQSAYTNIAGGIGLTAGVPFRVGNCVALAAGIELEEVIVLEWHDGLDDVVQPFQAGGDRDLDPAPDGWVDMIELDDNPGDAFAGG